MDIRIRQTLGRLIFYEVIQVTTCPCPVTVSQALFHGGQTAVDRF